MRRIALIARREIVAYASVPSFWIALLMGPLLIALTALTLRSLGAQEAAPPVQTVAIDAADPTLRDAAAASLRDAAALEHRRIELLAPGRAGQQTLQLRRGARGVEGEVRGQPLSELALALLRRDLATGDMGASATRAAIAQPPPPPTRPADRTRFARFSLTLLLWFVLVGSLGMLLQAVVRERTNRALESLLSAVRPSELVFGKLAGIGALAVLVVGAWLIGGAGVAASPLGGLARGGGVLFQGFHDPAMLAGAGALFLTAFAMYGSALIGLGALARDVPAAQNLSRPVFGLLLLIFFIALAQFSGLGDRALPGLALVPPFTPFVLLLARPGAIDAPHLAAGLAGMAATTGFCAWFATRALRGELRLRPRRPRTSVQTAAA